ncbi:MAG TPA: mannitol dehydrogenase family protein, partial [Microbacteriaceae bacterium]|nr:mannitol dehydrogenase family protein [Microbacteriaceae bacterium]
MTEAKRLSYATLGEARRGPAVRYPTKAAQGSTVGIVHFGLGAFYRALQSVYTGEAAAETGERQWGILGVTGRTDRVARQLHPQDGLYGVLVRGASKTRLQVVSAVRDVVWPGDAAERILDTIAAPTTHIITLTITEKGYHRAASGGVDTGAPAILAATHQLREELSAVGPGPRRGDVAEGPAPVPIGLLARGLARRFRRGGS